MVKRNWARALFARLCHTLWRRKRHLSKHQKPPAAKQAVFMLELQFLLKPFHWEGQDGFFNIKEHSGQGFFKNERNQKGPNLVSPATEQQYVYQLYKDFWSFSHFWHFFVLVFLCWKWKKYSIKISKTIASQLKNPLEIQLQMVTRMWLPSKHCPNLLPPHTKEYFSAQNYEGITDIDRINSDKYSKRIQNSFCQHQLSPHFGCICHYKDQLQIIKNTKRTICNHSPSMNDICRQDK